MLCAVQVSWRRQWLGACGMYAWEPILAACGITLHDLSKMNLDALWCVCLRAYRHALHTLTRRCCRVCACVCVCVCVWLYVCVEPLRPQPKDEAVQGGL